VSTPILPSQQFFLFENESEAETNEASNFVLISCVIDKAALREKQGPVHNPYHVALGFCLETLYEYLQEKNQ
jgi:hypothetical protein